MRQPTRSRRVLEDRQFDKTQLRMSGHGRIIHRDMGAHALRWNHVANVIGKQQFLIYGSWLAGLADGESCFSLKVNYHDDNKREKFIQFLFSIGLREDDQDTLVLAQMLMNGIGNIIPSQDKRTTNAKPLMIWTVCKKDEIAIVVDFFRRFPLHGKKLIDFDVWSTAFDQFYVERKDKSQGDKISDELFKKMKTAQNLLENSRLYETWKHQQNQFNACLMAPEGPALYYLKEIQLKYGWVSKHLQQGLSILDVGCGQDQNLLHVLQARIQTIPSRYLGIDLNKIAKKPQIKWAKIWDEFNFVDRWKEVLQQNKPFDVAVCFEVIEHMMPEDGTKLLTGIYNCLKPGGVCYLSTPVFNGFAAVNHCHEYTIMELQVKIKQVKFIIKQRIGTFASKPAIKKAMKEANDVSGLNVYESLENWLGSEVLACFMAPLYPDASRNNCWLLQKPE